MNERRYFVLAVFSSLVFSACSQPVAAPVAPTVETTTLSTPGGGSRHHTVTVRAAVLKVDVSDREVTLKGYDGTVETVKVGEEVRNLPMLKKGDEVVVTYYQSAAFEVLKKGDKRPTATSTEGMERAEVGKQPGGLEAKVVTGVAEVVKLDRQNKSATLRGPEGNVFNVDVENPDNFNKVKVGDKVEIRLTQAIAIDVAPAGSH